MIAAIVVKQYLYYSQFPKGIIVATMTTVTRSNAKWRFAENSNFKIADICFHAFNAYFQISSTNFKFTEDFQLFNDNLFQQWRVPLRTSVTGL